MIRTLPLEAADIPLADRQSMNVFIDVWNELGEDTSGDDFDWGILALADPEEKWGPAWAELTAESEALEQRMSDALEAHRSDCRTRYGYDFGEKNNGL